MDTIDAVMNRINEKIGQSYTNRDFSTVEKYTNLGKSINFYKTKIDEIINFTIMGYDGINDENAEEDIGKILPNYDKYVVDTFVFVYGILALNKSRIAVISYDIIFNCIDINRLDKYKGQSVKIRLVKNSWDFDVYGKARADKFEVKDNTFKVRVKNIDELFGKEKKEVVI